MSVQMESRISMELSRFLDLANSEIKLTASNMANIDTPGYHTVGFDFEAEMREAMHEADEDKPSRGTPKVFSVDHLIERPDGNNVSMDRESLKLAEDQLKFKIGVQLLKNQYQGILDAIHADK